jgi:sulfate adenylyltransferase
MKGEFVGPGEFRRHIPERSTGVEREIPRNKQGLAIFLTGLSGAGKSTIANALESALNTRAAASEELDRVVTVLDGDEVRKHLTKGLGFSREDRDTNVLRVGYVASLIARSRGIAVTALIAPYREAREEVKNMVEEQGGAFIEVHVATPLEVCEARDVKGLYAEARAGRRTGFTGIDDPYEAPENPDITVDTSHDVDPEDSAMQIIHFLEHHGYLNSQRN